MVAAAAAGAMVVATMATGVAAAMGVVELQVELAAILLLEVATALAATSVVKVGLETLLVDSVLPVAPMVVMSYLLVAASAATRMTKSCKICSRMTTSLTTMPTKGPSFCPPSYPSVPVKMR